MSDFTPIETQEQLDKVIGDRVKRAEKAAEKAAAEKYADYEDLKTQVADLTAQLQKQAETINGHKAETDALNAKIHDYETGSVKTAVAMEMGLPYQMASRLTGNTEEEIRADAEAMAKLIGTTRPVAPLGSPEPTVSNATNSAWAAVSSALNNN